MTEVSTRVPAFEHGRLRLFSVDGESAEGAELIESLKADPREDAALREALGTDRAEAYWVDLVALKDIAEFGLSGYLRQAYEVPEEQLEGADLTTARGHVLIVPSKSLGEDEQTLSPKPYLAPVAEFDVARDPGPLRPMDPAGATPQAKPEPTAKGGASGKGKRSLHPGAILVLLLIAAAFIVLVAL